MITIFLLLTAWAIIHAARKRHKGRRKPAKRLQPPAVVISPAEIERRQRAAERAQKEIERETRRAAQGAERQAKQAEREREKAEREAEKAERERKRQEAAEEKRRQEWTQAAEDYAFYKSRLSALYTQLKSAQSDLYSAERECEHDRELNSYGNGSTVTEKIVNRHISERDKALRRVMSLETQIHTAEKGLRKAQAKAN